MYLVTTSFREVPKSPTREQQIHPEFISRISIPASFRNPPSIPISPNSFSIKTTCSPSNASFSSFLIRVVLPAPRKPEIMSIFTILYSPFYYARKRGHDQVTSPNIFIPISQFYADQPLIMKCISLSMSSFSYATISSSGISPLEKMFARDTYCDNLDFRFSLSPSPVTSSTLPAQLSTTSKNF